MSKSNFLAFIAAAAIVSIVWSRYDRQPALPTSPVPLTENRVKANQCKQDPLSCTGGFVMYKNDMNHVLRIASCQGSTDCGIYTYRVDALIYGNDNSIEEIEIVLPHDPRWNTLH